MQKEKIKILEMCMQSTGAIPSEAYEILRFWAEENIPDQVIEQIALEIALPTVAPEHMHVDSLHGHVFPPGCSHRLARLWLRRHDAKKDFIVYKEKENDGVRVVSFTKKLDFLKIKHEAEITDVMVSSTDNNINQYGMGFYANPMPLEKIKSLILKSIKSIGKDK